MILIERHVMVGMSVGQSDHFNRGTVHLMIESLLSSQDSSTGQCNRHRKECTAGSPSQTHVSKGMQFSLTLLK